MYDDNSWEGRFARAYPTLYAFLEGAIFFLTLMTMSFFLWFMAGDM